MVEKILDTRVRSVFNDDSHNNDFKKSSIFVHQKSCPTHLSQPTYI